MNIILQKGQAYSADYSSTVDFPVLVSGWTGQVALYLTFPGAAVFTKPLVRVDNTMQLRLTVNDILGIPDGMYYFVATIANPDLGASVNVVDMATVVPVSLSDPGNLCTISMTIGKIDGSAAGSPSSAMTNTVGGTSIVSSWAGIKITATHAAASKTGNTILDTETVSTFTNAAGYAQLTILKGVTATITCPYFGKTVTVNTANLDAIDLSTYF